jgi:hypothetical protein
LSGTPQNQPGAGIGNRRTDETEYKGDLEGILTRQLQRDEPGPFSRVFVSDDEQFAVLQVAEKRTVRKLSHYGREFLRTGSVVLVTGESFLEPEEKNE